MEQAWQRLLRDALATLALSASQQTRAFGRFCASCELIGDFNHAREVAMGSESGLTAAQSKSLDEIDTLMGTMEAADCECFKSEVLNRPVWQRLRELAAASLVLFGWEGMKARPVFESSSGIWSGPSSEM